MSETIKRPSKASVTLSVPSITSLVLDHLISLLPSHGFLQRPPFYRALCDASLISPAFRRAAQLLLHRHLFFDGGARQMRDWLYAHEELGKRQQGEIRTDSVVLHDNLPFFLAEDGEEDLKKLRIDCPLSAAPSRLELAFHLEVLRVTDLFSGLSRRWSSTFSLLLPCCRNSLLALDLSDFLPFEPYELFLGPSFFLPLAGGLTTLDLPSLTLSTSSWSLALFALCCVNLEELSVYSPIDGMAITELLSCFSAPPLKYLTLHGIQGVIGAGVVHLLILPATDPLLALHDVLETWPTFEGGGLEEVELRGLRLRNGLGCSALVRLLMLEPWKGFHLEYSFDEEYGASPPEEEVAYLSTLYDHHVHFIRSNHPHLPAEQLDAFFERQQANLHEVSRFGDWVRMGKEVRWTLPDTEAMGGGEEKGSESSELSEKGEEEEKE
ncbi:hypothetical protein JCM11251_000386 [Rhodosporidiobolus azoricus]